MSDLIRRQDALSCFHDWIDQYGDFHTADEITEYRMIEQLASVESERPGRWCFNTDGKLVCSNCYETPTNRILLYGDMVFDMTPIREKMKYCPNCGCRMLKEGEEDE